MAVDINKLISAKGSINEGVKAALKDMNKTFSISWIDIENMTPSKDNFYDLSDIEELKETIESFGIHQNLILMKSHKSNKYEILAGHRRYEASRRLVAEGKTEFSALPCRIMPELDDTLKNIIMIITNKTRDKKDWEITEETARLTILYKQYRKEHPEFKGRTVDAVGEDLGYKKTQVGRHQKIDKSLIDDLKQEYKNEKIGVTAAAEIATLPEEGQKEALKIIKEQGTITTMEVKEIKIAHSQTDDQQYEKEKLILPKSHKTKAEIRIKYFSEDEKYRYGFDCQARNAGYCYSPSMYNKPYDTKEEARAAALKEMAAWNDEIKKSLISGGYLKKETETLKEPESENLLFTGTAKPKKESIKPDQPEMSETEIKIYAINEVRTVIAREIEKIPIDNEDYGRVTVNSIKLDRLNLLKQVLENDLESLTNEVQQK